MMTYCNPACAAYLYCFLAYVLSDEVLFGDESSYKGRYGKEPAHYEVVIPQKVTGDDQFISHVLPHHYRNSFYKKYNRMDDDDKVHYVVPIAGEGHHIELLPNNKMIGPSMVVETCDDDSVKERKIRKTRDVQCHFTGSVRGHENSRVAISTCYGLSGYIRTKRGYFIIEPAANHNPLTDEEHPHLVYQHEVDYEETQPNCDVSSENMVKILAKRRAQTTCPPIPTSTEEPEVEGFRNVTELHIETLVVLDKTILNYHKGIDIENYVLTVFNMAHDIYHDYTLGFNVNLAIVRLIQLDKKNHKLNKLVNKDVNKTLEYFRDWQNKMNPADDKHPNHHDVAVLLTRVDICGSSKDCGVLGAARVGGMCDPHNQAAICEDTGLKLGFVIAHEIAHTLAIPHDTLEESGCSGNLTRGLTTVMNPTISIKTAEWSKCSEKFMQLFMNSGLGKCLYDPPTEHSFQLVDVLPGVMYDAEFQCREMFGPNAAVCDTGIECNNLVCYLEDKGCVETHMPPAPGTTCDEKKWCYRGKCIEVGRQPFAVDGGWGRWSEWSECSRTCGTGVAYQERHCDNPKPRHGGKYCEGDQRRHKICTTQPCDPLQPSYRDMQCSEFDDWVYPEDGQLHTWTAYNMPEENPCILFCVNDQGAVASLKPRVEDGTTCLRGMKDVCVNGLCQAIPCDMNMGSDAVEDACGVCHGDGTSCELVDRQRTFKMNCSNENFTDVRRLTVIPRDAVNIKVEEVQPSESMIQVRSRDGRKEYVKGDALGMYKVPGSKAWLGMIRNKQEKLEIPGPICEPISIWIVVRETVAMKYSYGKKSKTKRVPSFKWEFIEWTPCSTQCGPGIQVSEARCVEVVAGMVDNKYCCNQTRLKAQVRPCEIAPCIPRWSIGDWQDCDKCPKGHHVRVVNCVRPTGEGEGEADVIPDFECARPKPKERQSCRCLERKEIKQKIVNAEMKREIFDDIAQFVETSTVLNNSTGKTNETRVNATVIERGKTIIDREDPSGLKLTIHVELEGGKYPKGIPHERGTNDTVISLKGKEAIKFLNLMQKDFSNNKTKI